MKKKFSLGAASLLLLCMCFVTTVTVKATTVAKDDFVIVDGVLTEYLGDDEVITIPEGVTKIAEGAFDKLESDEGTLLKYRHQTTILGTKLDADSEMALKVDGHIGKKIILSSTVKELEKRSIPEVTEEIVLNEGLEVINDGAFKYTNILFVKLPTTLKKLGRDVFSAKTIKVTGECEALTLSNRTFENDYSLRAIELTGVKVLPKTLFANCKRVKRISIVGDYNEAEGNAFKGAKNLRILVTSKAIEGDIYSICKKLSKTNVTVSQDGVKFNDYYVEGDTLIEYTGELADVVIPNDIKIIDKEAFYQNFSIEKVTMPDSVKTIKANAFAECKRLQTVKLSKKLTTIGYKAFYGCNYVAKYQLPKTLRTIGSSAFAHNYSLKKITIPAKVKAIEKYTFSRCINLTKVKLGKKVAKINKGAFIYTKLNKINLINVKRIGKNAFFGTKLVTVNLKNTEQIEKGAFADVKTIKKIKISRNAKIKNGAFRKVGFKKKVQYVK